MMYGWTKCTVGDVCSTVSETYRRKSPKVILINTSDVLEGKVLNHNYVDNVNLKGQFKKTFQKYDILFSEIRPANERYAFIDFADTQDYIASTKLMVIRPMKEKILPLYLYFILKSKKMLNELQYLAETRSGTFPQITFDSELSSMPIMLPNMDIQEKIITILKSIDDKIATNTAINKNLESQAQALYDNLFADVSFDATLADLGIVVGGSTPSKKHSEYYTDQGIAWITPKDLSKDSSKFIYHGENDITELGLSKCSATVMPIGTVLFSSRAPIGYIAIAANPMTTNQGFKSVIPNADIGTAFIYYFLKNNLNIIESMASGSTFKEISASTMKTVPAFIPTNGKLRQFRDFCEPLFCHQQLLESENTRLANLRDTLLPRLMSGEIDVSKILEYNL